MKRISFFIIALIAILNIPVVYSLSGQVELTIDKIFTEKKDNEIGYITKVVFTINNGKNKVLFPVVNVYAYDSDMDEEWQTRSRGQYMYTAGIGPGGKHTASIDLSPRTFRNLNLKKNIRLALNDAEDGFITVVNDAIIIGGGETTKTTSSEDLSPYDLSNYPSPFIKDGKFYGILVVGDKAPAEHVIAISDIAVSLQFAATDSGTVSRTSRTDAVTVERIDVGATKIASEVPNIKAINSILVGGPCDNTAVAEIMGNPANCKAGFEPGVGIIEAFKNFGNVALVVAGYGVSDVRNAGAVLANYNDYNLKGSKVEVKKVNNVLTITPIAKSTFIESTGEVAASISDKTLGSSSAPVTIELFDDFQGPFGARWYIQTFPKIKEVFIDKGYAKLIVKHFPLSFHPNAEIASIGAECAAEQGKYFEYIDLLYNNQNRLSEGDLKNYAKELGLDTKKFNECFEDDTTQDRVKADFEEGTKKGVTGTPSFFINEIKLVGAQPYNAFEDSINKALGGTIEKSKTAESISEPAKDEEPAIDDTNELGIDSIINQALKEAHSLKQSNKLQFNFFGEEHSITVDKVTSDSVTITLRSNPLTFIIELLKSIVIDINQDGKGDIGIKLNSVNNGIANLEFFKPSSNEPITTPTLKEDVSTPRQLPANLKYFIIGFIVLIVLVSGGYGLITIIKKRPKKEKIMKETEEETEEKPDKKVPFNKDVKETISVSNFTLKHGKNIILENVSFDTQKGDMVCLLGPSGTGKSTIIEALVGRKTPTKGTLKILGEDISKNKKIYDYVGFVPQHAELYMNQTVMQNLLSSVTKWGIKDGKNKAEKILSKIELSNRKDLKANKLSGGQQKLLSLGMELIRDIELCILDEPTTGLDPNTRNNIITILTQISTQLHKTIFFTTHFMDDAEECDQVIILANKKIVAQGPPSKLEKMLPGGGKIVNVILDNITDDLLEKIEKIEGVKKIVREGRNLRILTEEPNAIRLGQKIDEIGGVVNETKIDKATMMEVFVYHTGKKPE